IKRSEVLRSKNFDESKTVLMESFNLSEPELIKLIVEEDVSVLFDDKKRLNVLDEFYFENFEDLVAQFVSKLLESWDYHLENCKQTRHCDDDCVRSWTLVPNTLNPRVRRYIEEK